VLNRIATALGALAIVAYVIVALTGVEFGNPQREVVPPDVRQSPGGYRSFHFWHSGYQGGK
jgi:hypothetical protein